MTPTSTLKRLTQHPVFPQVKITRAPVPYLTGSSVDMKTVYIDPRVPETINVNGKRIPTAAPLAVHELYERAAVEVLKEACDQAGHSANGCDVYSLAHREGGEEAEKHFLAEHYDFDENDWNVYRGILDKGARSIAAEGPQGDPPPDLYTEMYAHAQDAGITEHPQHLGEQEFARGGPVRGHRVGRKGGGVKQPPPETPPEEEQPQAPSAMMPQEAPAPMEMPTEEPQAFRKGGLVRPRVVLQGGGGGGSGGEDSGGGDESGGDDGDED